MFIDPQPVATKTIVTSRYIALLKECELFVGAAAINMAPLAGWCGSFMNDRAAELYILGQGNLVLYCETSLI